MRIRTIKPEFWRSDDIGELTESERLLFIGLWSYVDDNGVGCDSIIDIVVDLYSRDMVKDQLGTIERVTAGLESLCHAGLIYRYEVDGKRYLHVCTWDKHQKINRPQKPRYPLPSSDCFDTSVKETQSLKGNFDTNVNDSQNQNYPQPVIHISTETCGQIFDDSEKPHDFAENEAMQEDCNNLHASVNCLQTFTANVVPGTGEQGNRGTEEQSKKHMCDSPPTSRANDYPDDFEQFWETYPRSIGKRKTLTAWQKALTRTTPKTILQAAQNYANSPNLPEERFIPHPTTWLNRDGWLDDPPQPKTRGKPAPPGGTTTDRVTGWLQLAQPPQTPETSQKQIESTQP